MKRFLRSLLGRCTPVRKQSRVPYGVQLSLEQLEDRVVPTILIKPNFAGEQLNGGPVLNAHTALQSPQIVLIFADDQAGYWTNTNRPEVTKITMEVTQIITSGFLSYLNQYGYDNKATVKSTPAYSPIDSKAPSFVNSTATDPQSINDAISAYLSGNPVTGDAGALARLNVSPDDLLTPVFVVVTAPTLLPVQGQRGPFRKRGADGRLKDYPIRGAKA